MGLYVMGPFVMGPLVMGPYVGTPSNTVYSMYHSRASYGNAADQIWIWNAAIYDWVMIGCIIWHVCKYFGIAPIGKWRYLQLLQVHILYFRSHAKTYMRPAEPEFENFEGAQETIPELIPGLLKSVQVRALNGFLIKKYVNNKRNPCIYSCCKIGTRISAWYSIV